MTAQSPTGSEAEETLNPLAPLFFEKLQEFPKRKFRKGEVIFAPGEPAQELYFIQEGWVKVVSYSSDGKELIKKLLHKGEIFGESALVQERMRYNHAVAGAPLSVSLMSVPELSGMMRQHPELQKFFLDLLSRQLIDLEKRLESIVFKSSRTRILEFLVSQVEEHGDRVGFEWVIRRFLSHQDIANITATSRQTVNSVLNDLRREEIITFNRRRLLVRDLEQLRAFLP